MSMNAISSEGDFVIGVAELPQVKRIGKGAPDGVANTIGQDESQDEDEVEELQANEEYC